MAMNKVCDNVYYLGIKGKPASGEIFFPSRDGVAEEYSTNVASGTSTAYPTPEGVYKIKSRVATSEKGIKLGSQGWKYPIVAVTEEGKETSLKDKDGHPMVWDPDKKDWRTQLLIHPDGNVAGTLGCVGIRGTPVTDGKADPTAGSADVLAAAKVDELLQARGESLLIVKYFPDQAAIDKHKELIRGLCPKKSQQQGSGDQSKTNQNAALINGEPTVLAGKNQRKVAYANGDCVHTGGACVAQGSQTVFVGKRQLPLARVDDPHADGQIVKTGEDTIQSA